MRILVAWMILTIGQLSGNASAQGALAPRPGSVRIVVYDETALPVAGAEVTLVAAAASAASSGSGAPARVWF